MSRSNDGAEGVPVHLAVVDDEHAHGRLIVGRHQTTLPIAARNRMVNLDGKLLAPGEVRPVSSAQQAVAAGDGDRLDPRVRAQSTEKLPDVSPHRRNGNVQFLGNLLG